MQRSPDRLQVGLVTDEGRINDGTFNQYAYEGLMRAAREHGLDPMIAETKTLDEVETNLRHVIDQGCNLVVTIGSRLGPRAERMALRYPDVHFVLVDHEPLPDSKNVTGLLFAEDQAGFLAGALAGLVTESGTVAFVGGQDIAPVRKFHKGFENGLAHTNRRAQVLETYTESFTDLAAGREAGTELVMHGADVVFAAAGSCGGAALQAAAKEGAWVIGVDQDQWRTTFEAGRVPGSEKLLTSALKRVDQAVAVAVTQAVAKGLQSGVMRFDLSNDGVGLAPYHEADVAVPSEVRGKIQEVTDGLRSGRVRTYVGPTGEDLRRGLWTRLMTWNWQSALLPFLAIVTALIILSLIHI